MNVIGFCVYVLENESGGRLFFFLFLYEMHIPYKTLTDGFIVVAVYVYIGEVFQNFSTSYHRTTYWNHTLAYDFSALKTHTYRLGHIFHLLFINDIAESKKTDDCLTNIRNGLSICKH